MSWGGNYLSLNLTSGFFPDDVDWKETPAAHVFKMDVPGVSREELKVEIVKGWTVRISGKRSRAAKVGRWSGRFDRTFKLHQNASIDHVRATMKDGVLTITVPKVEPLRSIPVEKED